MDPYTQSGEYLEANVEGIYPRREAHSSGVSWAAVIGGAFVAAAIYLILLALGAGFGLSLISPWSGAGISSTTADALTIVWMIVIEIVAAALGGYLTGRLRTKWVRIHNDEVYFRDTANGFLSWAVALVLSVAFLASAAASMAGRAIEAREQAPATATSSLSNAQLYFVDELFRSGRPAIESPAAQSKDAMEAEASRIMANGLRQSQMPPSDQAYLAQLVAVRTGLTPQESEQRVTGVLADARQAEDTARKATSHALLWLFLSLLMGAFSASFAATIGGRQRDGVKTV